MSKQYLTQSQALNKVSATGGSNSFCTRKWLEDQNKFNNSKLTNYRTNEFPVDDDIVKAETPVEPALYRNFKLNIANGYYVPTRIEGYLQPVNGEIVGNTYFEEHNLDDTIYFERVVKGRDVTILVNLENTDYKILSYSTNNCIIENQQDINNEFPLTLIVKLDNTIQDSILNLQITRV